MLMPRNYENTRVVGDYMPLPAGGYVCKVMAVEEAKSKAGNPMIIISLDIAEGEHKDRFLNDYKNNPHTDKKWGCRVWQLTLDKEGNTSRGFKGFMTSLEESNSGFKVQWSDDVKTFESQFKGKLVGGLFRREQYKKLDGTLGWSTKCSAFRSVETIKSGKFTVPADVLLEVSGSNDAFADVGFEQVSEDDLPF